MGKIFILIFTLFALQTPKVSKSNILSTSDTLIISGKLIEAENSNPIYGGTIELNGKTYSVGESGNFCIKVDNSPDLKLIFKSIGFRPLLIKNLRPDSDTIKLGTIPMFEGTVSFINYTCEWWQLICKYHNNRYSKGLDRCTKKERIKSNKIVDQYRYEFRIENFPIIHSKKYDLLTIEL